MQLGSLNHELTEAEWTQQSRTVSGGGGMVIAAPKTSESEQVTEEEELTEEAVEEPFEDEEEEPKISLSNPRFIRPESGYDFEERCTAEVTISEIGENPTKDVEARLYCNYKDSVSEFVFATSGEYANGTVEISINLDYPDAYLADLENDEASSVEFYFEASHSEATESVTSSVITLPDNQAGKDAEAQAAIMKEAAEDGTPFCEECEKAENVKDTKF